MKERFILVKSDGFSISHTIYHTHKEAYADMEKEYNNLDPARLSEEYADMTYISDNAASFYDEGCDVYLWEIIHVVC